MSLLDVQIDLRSVVSSIEMVLEKEEALMPWPADVKRCTQDAATLETPAHRHLSNKEWLLARPVCTLDDRRINSSAGSRSVAVPEIQRNII